MIIVSLNVRELGRPEKRLAVRKMVRNLKVDGLLLQETKVASNIHSVIRDVWGNRRCPWEWVPRLLEA